MKKILSSILLAVLSLSFTYSQKVDSIKVEQTGDFIKIGYKIIDSKPGQVYRVKVLCSINGGLNTEIRSVSGDTGDNVQGGKNEYFVVWDVLKDVDELKSAEFIVRAELVPEIAAGSSAGKVSALTLKWSKKWFHVGPAIEAPGPKFGIMAGVMGSFGIAAVMTQGKYAVDGNVAIPAGVSLTIDKYLEGRKVNPITVFLTKRIVNINSFQMHLMAGFKRTHLLFVVPGANATPYQAQKVFGPSVGLTFDVSNVAFTIMADHIDPGQVEKKGDFYALSPLNYFSTGICFRF